MWCDTYSGSRSFHILRQYQVELFDVTTRQKCAGKLNSHFEWLVFEAVFLHCAPSKSIIESHTKFWNEFICLTIVVGRQSTVFCKFFFSQIMRITTLSKITICQLSKLERGVTGSWNLTIEFEIYKKTLQFKNCSMTNLFSRFQKTLRAHDLRDNSDFSQNF